MSKGFLWFAQNNEKTNYVELSIKLAKSIKKYNKENKICVITDQKSAFEDSSVDIVKVMENDDRSSHDIKWANEYKAFTLTPFTHTIKLEADMLWTTNTDWWWYHLWQHNLIFSVDCRDYRDNIVKDKTYRQLFIRNKLPNIYNGLIYFRKSKQAKKFFDIARAIVTNWQTVQKHLLISCHDQYPSTDVVYALAYRILDPTNKHLVDFDWFKFIHHKPAIHNLKNMKDINNYLYPNQSQNKLYLGEQRVSRVWHYFDKEIDVRLS